jgi:cardiolipin synthase
VLQELGYAHHIEAIVVVVAQVAIAAAVGYTGGLLHTKSITIDGEIALFGTANLDIRSLSLNFELMLAIYDESFARGLLALQRSYERESVPVALEAWRARPVPARLAEGIAYMAAPLL